MKISNCFLFISAVFVVCLFSGCATKELRATYTVPPSVLKVSNLSEISPMRIVSTVELGGNLPGNKGALEALLSQQVAANLCHKGALTSTDVIWGTGEGASKLGEVLERHGNVHGYARYVSEDIKAATLYLTVSASFDCNNVAVPHDFRLRSVRYIRVDTPEERRAGLPPRSVPDYRHGVRYQNVRCNYNVVETIGQGTLVARLVGKNGAVLYQQTFPMSYSQRNDMQVHEAPMVASSLFARMTIVPVECLAGAISPRRVVQRLGINKSGSKQGVLLLEALAYSEAATYLENLAEKTSADWENLGLAYEILGDYSFAKEAYRQGKCADRLHALEAMEARFAGQGGGAGIQRFRLLGDVPVKLQ